MGAKHSWDAADTGFHDRWGPCPTHTTWSAAIFASVAAWLDAINRSVSASGPIRAMSFVVPKSLSGFVTAAGQSIGIKSQRRSSKRSFGENTTSCARIGPTSKLGMNRSWAGVLYGGQDNLHLGSVTIEHRHAFGAIDRLEEEVAESNDNLHHAQTPAVLDHSRALPQGDGRARPAFTGRGRSRVRPGSPRCRRHAPQGSRRRRSTGRCGR